jgi:hypothetical protein
LKEAARGRAIDQIENEIVQYSAVQYGCAAQRSTARTPHVGLRLSAETARSASPEVVVSDILVQGQGRRGKETDEGDRLRAYKRI